MMINRHGVKYIFEPVDENTYKLVGDFGVWMRYGSRGMKSTLDYNDLSFVDPSGGPFICLGGTVEGREVVNLSATHDGVFIKVLPQHEKEVVNG